MLINSENIAMHRYQFLRLTALLAVVALTGAFASACDQCGCCNVRKVCRLVPDVKKTTTYCYSYECEDFCLNGRSKCVGTEQVCTCRGPVCKNIMQPTCCEVMTRRVLTKVPVVKEKHGWKCVVETVCCGCGNCCNSREATEVESKIAIINAERSGADAATATGDVSVPLDGPIVLTSATEVLPNTEAVDEEKSAQPSKANHFFKFLFRK